MDQKKKITAAAAAVVQYIQSEEASRAAQAAGMPVENKRISPADIWAASGRQSQMQMRNLMQMKSFHAARVK